MIDKEKLLQFLNNEIVVCDIEWKNIAKIRKDMHNKYKNGGSVPDYTQLNNEDNFWCGYRDAITEVIDFLNNEIEKINTNI